MSWTKPKHYIALNTAIQTFTTNELEQTASRLAAIANVGLTELEALIQLPRPDVILIVPKEDDITAMPPPAPPRTMQIELIYPYYAERLQPPAIIVPPFLSPPIRPLTSDMQKMLVWRETGRHYCVKNTLLNRKNIPLWAEEMVAWASAVSIARRRQMTLTGLIIGMHDGTETPPASAYVNQSISDPQQLMGLHKRLAAICIELCAELGGDLLIKLLSAMKSLSEAITRENLMAEILGRQAKIWLKQHPQM